jgi:hypothetical protein
VRTPPEGNQPLDQDMVGLPLSYLATWYTKTASLAALPLTVCCLVPCRFLLTPGTAPRVPKATGSRSSRNRTFVHLRDNPSSPRKTPRSSGLSLRIRQIARV